MPGPKKLLPDSVQLQYPRGAGVSVQSGQPAAAQNPGASQTG